MKAGVSGHRWWVSAAIVAFGAAILLAGSARVEPASARAASASADTFNIAFGSNAFDSVDPALAYSESWLVLDATCVRLMNFPDKPPPDGLRVVPEVAAAYPRVSKDAKTFTFTLRNGFRFSDGTPVLASAFAREINRVLALGNTTAGSQFVSDIVGARAVQSGKSTSAAGVVADGNRLVIRFTRPVPDFPAQTTMPFFCAVPPTLPSDPEGVGAVPGSGPYFISEYVRGERLVLERNRFYKGSRPRRIDRFVVDLDGGDPADMIQGIDRGDIDWADFDQPNFLDPTYKLIAKYGVNRDQLFVRPGSILRGYFLNLSRGIFRDNLPLRRAVNFAVNRTKLIRRGGLASSFVGRPTDQFQPANTPGFRDARIYPLARPDVRRARALSKGRTRTGRVVLWTQNVPQWISQAQVLKQELQRIGLEVQIKGFPPQALFAAASAPGARYDILLALWIADYFDPYEFANVLFDGSNAGVANFAHLDSPDINALLRRAARLPGDARYRAYQDLDVRLARDVAPMIAIENGNWATLVSKRAGCLVLKPTLDLTAVCIK
jgi:peptide/nickel transport system substrate-binding protein